MRKAKLTNIGYAGSNSPSMDYVEQVLKKNAEESLKLPGDDLVNHPSHYTFGRFEVIDVLQDWFPYNPLLWQVVKYVARARYKGNMLQDLKKAQFYLNKAIQQLEVDLGKEKMG
jgi:hypothetical protein